MSKLQCLVRQEGLDKLKKIHSPHQLSNPRSSGLQHSALTTTLPHAPEICISLLNSVLNLFLYHLVICYSRCQVSELDHIFTGTVSWRVWAFELWRFAVRRMTFRVEEQTKAAEVGCKLVLSELYGATTQTAVNFILTLWRPQMHQSTNISYILVTMIWNNWESTISYKLISRWKLY
jgi:hypothetical protein